MDKPVRVRMAPSPTGSPHVGLVRTALFNWAYARKTGGSFILRIEDTDAERNTEESYRDILDLFSWLGLAWDEGPDVGGPHGPYRQSERTYLYRDALSRLAAAGHTYACYCAPDEVKARRSISGSKAQGYDGHCRTLTLETRTRFLAAGRKAVTRLRIPSGELAWHDLVRGPVAFHSDNVPDPVLAKADGSPLYALVNPVDDALMGITHVLRGEDMLPSTPRQIPLYHALASVGMGDGPPLFGHLPYVMGKGNAKLSKRDPEANALTYREDGFVPEGMLNYLALLGWGFSGDRDVFTLDEMVEAFSLEKINPNPARFDLTKAEALNAAHLRMLAPTDVMERALPFLQASGLVSLDPGPNERQLLARLAPLVAPRISKLTEVADLCESFLVRESLFAVDGAEASKTFNDDGLATLARSREVLASLAPWTAEALQAALHSALVEQLGLKPRLAYGPLRLATSGKRISPPLFESMEILGRSRTLSRIDNVLES